MATGDFWNRLTRYGITDATPIDQGKIPAALLRAMMYDVGLGSGGITVASAKTYLRLASTAATEFQDLVDSVANVTNANANVQRQLRLWIAEALICGVAISEWGKIGGGTNPYQTGESLRLRVKELITALAPGGAAALVGSMAL